MDDRGRGTERRRDHGQIVNVAGQNIIGEPQSHGDKMCIYDVGGLRGSE